MSTETKDDATQAAPGLSAEVTAMMDKAVRYARRQGLCDRFDRMAAIVFAVPINEVVDSDGLSCDGRDREGFKNGYDRDGYNREGYSQNGYNRNGYNREGYNRYGLNEAGLDRHGRDGFRYDYDGYDQDGFNASGTRAAGSRGWYENQASKSAEEFCYDRNRNRRPTTKTSY